MPSRIMYAREMATVCMQLVVAECYLAPFVFVQHDVDDDNDGFADYNVKFFFSFGRAKGAELKTKKLRIWTF